MIDARVKKRVLEFLVNNYPNYVSSQLLYKLDVDIDKNILRAIIKYFEEKLFVEVRWFLGGNFMVKASSLAVDSISSEKPSMEASIKSSSSTDAIVYKLTDSEKKTQEKDFSKFESNTAKNSKYNNLLFWSGFFYYMLFFVIVAVVIKYVSYWPLFLLLVIMIIVTFSFLIKTRKQYSNDFFIALSYSLNKLSTFNKDSLDHDEFGELLSDADILIDNYLDFHEITKGFGANVINYKLPLEFSGYSDNLRQQISRFSDYVVREKNLAFLDSQITNIFGKLSVLIYKKRSIDGSFTTLLSDLKSVVPESKNLTRKEKIILKLKTIKTFVWERKGLVASILALLSIVTVGSYVFDIDIKLTLAPLVSIIVGSVIYKLIDHGFLNAVLTPKK